ncbi:MAG: hypothetical protein LC114_04910 [Bryobacterales bacterium]|nr:hypothetical protein [Bryobacterales bacterium]
MTRSIRRYITIGFLSIASVVSAQNPDAGRVARIGDRAVLVVDGPRPVDSAAITLAQEFGIAVSVEDPPYIFQDDIRDVTSEVSLAPNPSKRVFVPKGGRLEVHFDVNADGTPRDLPALLRDIVSAANAQLPFAFRIDTNGSRFTLVPTRTRDARGQTMKITPLLDRLVTIPLGTRSIAATAALMADALAAQTGLRVSCCQGAVAGIPWGMEAVTFEAQQEPARTVLTRLISAAAPDKFSRAHWLQRCDPQPSAWCFINLAYVDRSATAFGNQSLKRPDALGGMRWFAQSPSQR